MKARALAIAVAFAATGCHFVFGTREEPALDVTDWRVESAQDLGDRQRVVVRATCRTLAAPILGAAVLIESLEADVEVVDAQLRCPALGREEEAPSTDTVVFDLVAGRAFDPAAIGWLAASLNPVKGGEQPLAGGAARGMQLVDWTRGGGATVEAVLRVASARADVEVVDGVAASAVEPGVTLTTGDSIEWRRSADPAVAFESLAWTLEIVRAFPAGAARARTRTLDALGHPLGGVLVEESGPAGARTLASDPDDGGAVLGSGAGPHRWRFEKPGHLPVWREASLLEGVPARVPSPWLAARGASQAIGSLGGGEAADADRRVVVSFPPGAFDAPADVTVTALGAQALPARLPLGWSPLAAFWVEASEPLTAPASVRLAAAPAPGAVAAFVQLDESALGWRVVELVSGGETLAVPALGAFALVVADAGAVAPPAPEPGSLLAGVSVEVPSIAALSASATVEPDVAPASTVGRLVTGTATIEVRGDAPLPSGALIASEVSESYALAAGAAVPTPPYDASFFAHQQPGDGDARTLHAKLPTRPRLLFGADELVEARVTARLRAPDAFAGAWIGPDGGAVTAPGMELRARPGDLDDATPVSLRALDPASLVALVGGAGTPRVAFDLEIPALAAGRALAASFPGQAPNAFFVLARTVAGGGVQGLEPVERFASDAAGELRSVEPANGPRLPGVVRGGAYVLVQVATGQGLVEGVARDTAGVARSGLAVRIEGLPWLTFSGAGGAFRLVAPPGDATVVVLDLASGDEARAVAALATASSIATLDLATAPTGPRVVATEPADGSTGADAVTPVRVTFSEPVAPASLAGEGFVLRAPDGSAVAATLVLERGDTRAVLLPAEPLAYGALYEIALGAGVVDRSGLALEGARLFRFTVEAAPTRLAGAQLVSWEPGAAALDCAGIPGLAGAPPETCSCADVPGFDPADVAISCVLGTAGAADPEVPVILSNESTGETATVLSNADGSFESFVAADVDDRLSATFVNANGTRVTLPLARQLFDDGSVALFAGGGILEAESDGGPVQVLIEPGAIASKTKFKLELPSIQDLLALTGGVEPAEGQLLGGITLTQEGDALRTPADVVLPVDAAALDLAPGESPADRAFAVVRPIEVDGVALYAVADKAVYDAASGTIRTASPPFAGVYGDGTYGAVMLGAPAMQTLVVQGVVASAPEDVAKGLTSAQIRAAEPPVRREAGALVTTGSGGNTSALVPGSYVGVTDGDGRYALTVPFQPALSMRALSLLFPGATGRGFAAVGIPQTAFVSSTVDMVIPYPAGLVAADAYPPQILTSGATQALAVGEPATVSFTLLDDSSVPDLVSVELDAENSASLVPGQPLGSVSIVPGTETSVGPTSARVDVAFEVERAALVVVRMKAVDAAGNEREISLRLLFGATPQPSLEDPLPFPNDVTPPRVVWISPADGALVESASEIVVRFSEVVSKSLEESGVLLSAGDGEWTKGSVTLSPDQIEARIAPGALQPGKTYSLSIDAHDLAGNPATFHSTFRVAAGPVAQLTGATTPLDTLVSGSASFTLDRDLGLVVHDLESPGAPVATLALREFPRAMTLVPRWSYVREPGGTPIQDRTLLVIAGGLIGSEIPGQWFWIVDVTDPKQPRRIASTNGVIDFAAAVSVLRWSAPYFYAAVNTTTRGFVLHVNLQALILGAEEFAADDYAFGFDANADGDYADPDDVPPIPQRETFFGHERTTAAALGRSYLDFDVALGGSVIASLYGRVGEAIAPSLQAQLFGGVPVGDGLGTAGSVPLGAPDARRLRLDPSFPVNGGFAIAALVARGNLLEVWDLSDPLAPVKRSSIDVGEGQRIGAIERMDERTWAVVTQSAVLLLDRDAMADAAPPEGQAHPALRTKLAGGATGVRSFGASEAGIVVPSGVFSRAAPRIDVVRVPAKPVTGIEALLAQGDGAVRDFLGARLPTGTLLPANLRSPGDEGLPSALDDPPPPALHYYATIEADGALGPEIRLALEALDRSGRPIAPRGPLFPPVILTDQAGALGIADAQPEAKALVARRLSDDPASDLYDRYLSDPFFVARESLLPEHLEALGAVPGRQMIWSGDLFRLSFDAEQNQGALGAQELDGAIANQSFVPGLSRSFGGFCGEYVDSPNPAFERASPHQAGVTLHSGELRHSHTDATAEGRSVPLAFTRTYASRAQYLGPIGRGMDHSYNVRLCELPLGSLPAEFQLPLTVASDPRVARTAVPGDVLLIDGEGDVELYHRILPAYGNAEAQPLFANDPAIEAFGWTDRVIAYYESPRDDFSALYRLSHGGFVRVDAAGGRAYFSADGRIEEVAGVFEASRLRFAYRADGKLDAVENDLGRRIEFGYYGRTTSPDFVPSQDVPYGNPIELGLIGRIDADGEIVDFRYDANASLVEVEPESAPNVYYGYDPEPPYLLKSIQRGAAEDPFQTVLYENGLVKSTTLFGRTYEFGGAVATAQERLDAGDASLSMASNGASASFPIDSLGRPTGFAGLDFEADDAGRTALVESEFGRSEITYDSESPVWRFRGNVIANLRNGFGSSFGYDGSAWNRRTTVTDENGIETTFSYSPEAMTAVTDSLLVVEQTGAQAQAPRIETLYDLHGQLREERRTDGVESYVREIVYDANDRPVGERIGDLQRSSLDWGGGGAFPSVAANGLTYTASTDALGRPAAITASGAPSWTRSWDGFLPGSDTVTAADGASFAQTYSYVPNEPWVDALVEQETGLPDVAVDYEYDAFGRLLSYTANGDTWSFSYDASLDAGADGPGYEQSVVYDDANRPDLVTEQGVATDFGYDALGRTTTIASQGATQTLTYHGDTRRVASVTTTDAEGVLASETYGWDGAGRVAGIEDETGLREIAYFPDDEVRRITLNGRVLREAERDSGGRFTAVATPGLLQEYGDFDPQSGGPTTSVLRFPQSGTEVASSLAYAGGRLQQVTDPAGSRSYAYDGFGRLAQEIDPDGVAQGYGWSPSGIALARSFGDGTQVALSYVGDRRLAQIGGVIYGFDDEKLVSSVTTPDGAVTLYDRSGNPFFEPNHVTTGTLVRDLFWEEGRLDRIEVPATGDAIDFDHDGFGRERSVARGAETVVLGYDAFGNRARETTPLGTFERTRNAWNDLDTEHYPSGLALLFQPDSLGHPTQILGAGIASLVWKGPAVLDRVAYQGGLVARREYDAALRLDRVVLERPDAGGGDPVAVAGLDYARTPGGRLLSVQRLDTGRFDVFERNAPAQGMRITGFRLGANDASGGAAQAAVLGLGFDANGESTAASSATGDARATFAGFTTSGHRLATVDGDAVLHDDDGNVTGVPLWVRLPASPTPVKVVATLEYDGLGALRRVVRADGVAVEYVRDGFGRITTRRVTGPADRCRPGTFRFVWAEDRLIEEYEGEGAAPDLVRRWIWVGPEPVLVQAAATPGGALADYVPLVEENGSVRGWLATDGGAIERIDYGPYGMPRIVSPGGVERAASVVADTLLFHGAFFDRESGLYQMGVRNLHPQLGRFLQRDPILYVASRALYTAFDGDPASTTDASGAAPQSTPDVAAGLKTLEWALRSVEATGHLRGSRTLVQSLRSVVEASDFEAARKPAWRVTQRLFAGVASGLAAGAAITGIEKSWPEVGGGLRAAKAVIDAIPAVADIRESSAKIRSIAESIDKARVSARFSSLGGAYTDFDGRAPTRMAASAKIVRFQVDAAGKTALRPVNGTQLWAARNKLWSARLAIAKGGFGVAKGLLTGFFRPPDLEARLAQDAGLALAEGTLDVADALVEAHRLATPGQALGWLGRISAGGAIVTSFYGGTKIGEAAGYALADLAYACERQRFQRDGGYFATALAFLVSGPAPPPGVLPADYDPYEYSQKVLDFFSADPNELSGSELELARACNKAGYYEHGLPAPAE